MHDLLPETSKFTLVHPDFIEKYIDVGYLIVRKIMVRDHEEVIVDCTVIDKFQKIGNYGLRGSHQKA